MLANQNYWFQQLETVQLRQIQKATKKESLRCGQKYVDTYSLADAAAEDPGKEAGKTLCMQAVKKEPHKKMWRS